MDLDEVRRFRPYGLQGPTVQVDDFESGFAFGFPRSLGNLGDAG